MVLAVAVLLVGGAILFTLFVRTNDIPEAPPVSPTLHLEERKARIYENLRDLQFEYRLGKLSDEDYQKTKLSVQAELAAVLADIDKVNAAQPVLTAVAAKAPKAPPQPVRDGRTCPSCGARFERDLKFCGECGKAMIA